MAKKYNQHLVILLLATLCISSSAVLGRYIAMPVPVIIWFRCAIGGSCLFLFCRFKKKSLKLKSPKHRMPFLLGAVFLGLHWLSYFYALKLSNVALGMLSLFTFPIITTLLEPLFIKVKLDPMHIVLGILVLIGIYILAPEFNLENEKLLGVLLGIFSAFCYAIRILILKQQTKNYDGTVLMFYQVFLLGILLLPIMFLMDSSGIKTQFPYILLLGILPTAIGHTLFLTSLRHFRVSTATIINSAQPVYGIIIAFIALNEVPTWNTFFGGLLILSTVVIESIRSSISPKANP